MAIYTGMQRHLREANRSAALCVCAVTGGKRATRGSSLCRSACVCAVAERERASEAARCVALCDVAGWPCGRVAVWPCGRMAVWSYGPLAVWLCGRVAMWPHAHARYSYLHVAVECTPVCARNEALESQIDTVQSHMNH